MKRKKLRHNEYYNLQECFDALYAQSVSGEKFYGLIELMSSNENIVLLTVISKEIQVVERQAQIILRLKIFVIYRWKMC